MSLSSAPLKREEILESNPKNSYEEHGNLVYWMLQNSDYWPRCPEFVTSIGQSEEVDRKLLSPSKNVKRQTRQPMGP